VWGEFDRPAHWSKDFEEPGKRVRMLLYPLRVQVLIHRKWPPRHGDWYWAIPDAGSDDHRDRALGYEMRRALPDPLFCDLIECVHDQTRLQVFR